MNKQLFTAAASKGWLYALLMTIFMFLWIFNFLTVIPLIGDLIPGMVFLSLMFMALNMRDAAYAFEGEQREAMKGVAVAFLMLLIGLIVKDYGSLVIAIIWKIVFGVLVLLAGLKIKNGFALISDVEGASNMKVAGTLFLVCGILGILACIPVISAIFITIFKIIFVIASIMMIVGMGKMKAIQ